MYDQLKIGLSAAVPFARYVGIELIDIGPGSAKARLAPRPDLLNHIATIHAGALFTLAETASGAATAGAFADMVGLIRPVAAEARIAYLKLARTAVNCIAETSIPAEQLNTRLREEGKVVFDVRVTMTDDDGRAVAEMSVSWNVRLIAPQTEARAPAG